MKFAGSIIAKNHLQLILKGKFIVLIYAVPMIELTDFIAKDVKKDV